MAKTRYMFIPWNRRKGKAGDFNTSQPRVKWEEQRGKEYTVIYADHDDPEVFKFAGDTSEVTIYVRGHGKAGGRTVSNGEKRRVRARDVCKMLVDLGLQPAFQGKIKFYHCNSATDGTNGELSFAARCASYLRKAGYTRAFYFGYTGSIDGYYEQIGSKNHRWTTIQGTETPKLYIGGVQIGGGPTTQRVRVSSIRVPM